MDDLVVVTDAAFPDVDAERAAAENAGARFKLGACKTAEEVVACIEGARVAVVQFAPLTAAAIARLAPSATVIRYGVGYNNLDLEAMRAAGVRGAYVPDYCTDEVADHTASMILARLRKLQQLDASVREGTWKAVAVARPMPAFSETTVGFFGFGRIAQSVATRLAPFGFKILACDPFFKSAKGSKPDVEAVDFEDLLTRSDCISLHAPATKETVGIFNRAAFAAMKPTAILVNTARGDLIVEADLTRALSEGVIAGAGLDVFAQEPLTANSALRTMPNVLLTPHAAWYSDVAVRRLQSLVADEIARALRGDAMRRPIPDLHPEAIQ